jgi:hypothetical protein
MFTLRYPADFFGLSGAKDGRERMQGTYEVRWYESDDAAAGKISRHLAKDSFRL